MAGAKKPRGRSKTIARRGLMLVLSSPSGAGKTTLSRMLLKSDSSVKLSVSVTTRARRANEREGRDYHFIDKGRFAAMKKNDELLELAEVFGNLYGTPRAPVEKALAAGRDVLFDIDWQGTQQLREKVARRHGQHLRLAANDPGARASTARARAGRRRGDQRTHGEGWR